MWNIWRSEWRITTRQRSYFAFFLLWIVVMSLLFSIVKDVSSLSTYTNATGTILNLVLYILPLFMLISGSFSIANEMESGQWRLLCTYPISSTSYVVGKLGGQFTAQVIVFTMSYGVSIIVGMLLGISLSFGWVVALYIFSIWLMLLFLMLGISLGTFARTRWFALTVSVMIWFFLIIMWPSALIAFLSYVPYNWIAPILQIVLFFNPAELLRVLFIIVLDGGSVFGQTYDTIVFLFQSKTGWSILILYTVFYLFLCIALSSWKLERRKWQ